MLESNSTASVSNSGQKELMQTNQLQTLRGFRDFLPAEKRKRDFVANKMRSAFELNGFQPLETPTLEYAALLMGKYGEEADKLVYSFQDRGDRAVALRYDQTVPSARILVQYRNVLPRYFRRYQIQNVFRADKPQKGRYREFMQCDCDIFDSTSPLADAEILAVFARVYETLGFSEFVIEVNDRKTLIETLQPFATEQVPVFSIIQTIDKLDKQTPDEVRSELIGKGLSADRATLALETLEQQSPSAELQEIIDKAVALGVQKDWLKFNPALARGLDYYTGLIFEGKVPGMRGSLGGGGRYDKLIEQLSGFAIPAVGFGIGFDRTVEAAEELGLIPDEVGSAKVLVTIFDENTTPRSLEIATELRKSNIATEVYPAVDKLAKQFKLANQKQIPYVVIIGENELKENIVTLKDMQSGAQQQLSVAELRKKLT
jgi:histidyl-tRNA synthetase